MIADISYVSYYEKFPLSGEVKCIDEEIPFEIPNGWVWERWGNISLSIQYGFNAPAKSNGRIKMVRISDIQEDKILWDKVPFCDINEREILNYLLHPNDILFARTGGTVGKSFLVKELPKEAIYAGYLIRTIYNSTELSPSYLKLFMGTELYWEQLKKGTIATAQPNCNGQTLGQMLTPLPPLAEQQRIVEKMEELIPHIEHYGKAQTELDWLNINIKGQLKKSVLQYAIEGKLVPQDEAEGTAEELLLQIQAEKLKLYEEGKLKKKDLEHSTIFKGEDNKYYEKIGKNVTCIDEEIPFEIPNGWVWARGTTLFLPMESTKPKEENFTYIDLDAVNNKKNNIDNPKILKSTNAPSRASRKLHTNDVLYSMVRPYLRNIALVDKKFSNAIASTGFYVITPSIALNPHFLFRLMLSSYVTDGLNLFMKGENSPSINNSHIEDFLYPFPPLAEQQRIVESIEAIFRCIERN